MRSTGALLGRGDPSPITVAGRAPRVLAIHGFSGTPQEVALVCEVAGRLGLGAHAPLLPGHGTTVSDLARTRWDDWLGHAERSLLASDDDEPVIVAGLSLGSLIGAHLAALHPSRVLGLVMLANAVRLHRPFPDYALAAWDALRLPDFSVPKAGPDIGDPVARAAHLTYDAQPIHAVLSVRRAGALTLRQLGGVTCPALVVHGERDRVCPASNGRLVMCQLGSPDKRLVMLPRAHHIVTRDAGRDVVSRELERFIGRLVDA